MINIIKADQARKIYDDKDALLHDIENYKELWNYVNRQIERSAHAYPYCSFEEMQFADFLKTLKKKHIISMEQLMCKVGHILEKSGYKCSVKNEPFYVYEDKIDRYYLDINF